MPKCLTLRTRGSQDTNECILEHEFHSTSGTGLPSPWSTPLSFRTLRETYGSPTANAQGTAGPSQRSPQRQVGVGVEVTQQVQLRLFSGSIQSHCPIAPMKVSISSRALSSLLSYPPSQTCHGKAVRGKTLDIGGGGPHLSSSKRAQST